LTCFITFWGFFRKIASAFGETKKDTFKYVTVAERIYIDNLQVPKVHNFLWEQLKTHTKTQDVQKQNMLGVLNQSMVLQAMDHAVGNKAPDNSTLKTYISDAVKIISGEVNKINQQRREAIK
jgi:hypothetical protein